MFCPKSTCPCSISRPALGGTQAHKFANKSEFKWCTNSWGAEKKGEWLVSIDRMA